MVMHYHFGIPPVNYSDYDSLHKVYLEYYNMLKMNFLITAAGCCAMWQPLKVSPHSSIVQIIFYFWSCEIMKYILRNRKRSYVKMHFLNKFEIFWYFSSYISL